MIPELGLFALIAAFVLTLLQAFFPIVGIIKKNDRLILLSKPINIVATFLIFLSFLILLYSFVQDDFSIQYVAKHSNSSLPFLFKLSALWGGHEGSLLLWILLLAVWSLVLNIFGRSIPSSFLGLILAVLGCINAGFLLFLLCSSNPFIRLLPQFPLDGMDLNPLLQDIGLVFHPPILYIGYVGTAIPFAFAVAALLQPNIIQTQGFKTFANWVRPYILIAFAFLTMGIAWGSYWAYYELGWGGWWFWDPVENASFMPWLCLIALIHTVIVLRKRQLLMLWSLLLMILSFALSLLGTFLVRSGILTSVHAFATDPKRGAFILLLFLLFIGAALILFSIQGRKLFSNMVFEVKSRESLLLLNSILLIVAVFSILLGTLFPLIVDVIFRKKISVGFPYFNAIFIPLTIPILLSIPIGPFIHFGNNAVSKLADNLKGAFFVALIASVCAPVFFPGKQNLFIILGIFLSVWVCLGSLQRLMYKYKNGGIRGISIGAWGMVLAHFGIGLMVLGVTLVSNYEIERDLRLSPTQTVALAGYEIYFDKIETIEGDNFVGYKGHFQLFKHKKNVTTLQPEKRTYVVQNTTLTETAIHAGFLNDIYISLGEKLSNGDWTVRIYYKPGVRFIWLGAILIAFASLILGVRHL